MYRRCDGKHRGGKCPSKIGKVCTLKKRVQRKGDTKYTIKACVANAIGDSCKPKNVPDIKYITRPTDNQCEENMGQKGSVTFVDLTLPAGKVYFLTVTTNVPGQNSTSGFFVRPTHLTRNWGKATVTTNMASFYLAETGQFSVEFTSDATWRDYKAVQNFDALMIFVNPPLSIPSDVELIQPPSLSSSNKRYTDLGPNKKYMFVSGINYDWGRDHVFKVHDDTSIYFEEASYVRARIVQTEKKVKNVNIQGYGTLDVHHNLKYDLVGISDDATRQNVGIYGKNIEVKGLTLLNTNPTCGLFGYCLNINANWSPIVDKNDPFDADELQLKDPPFKFRQAHCQDKNMDDSPNNDFTNCPTSYDDGQRVSYVKCMTWNLGHDGLNAGKWGIVEKSFIRANDDAIKPWDSHGIYRDITIWQLMLGWPINFGWWNWNSPDVSTTVENIYVIHNQNWASSAGWPETQSGQCVVGGVYGSGAVKEGYRLKNIFVETAASCAVGLQISKNAYSRHPTPDGCVGSMIDMHIENMYFDEDFYQTGGYNNYLSGENNPKSACKGALKGEISKMTISGLVAGKPLTKSDFIVDDSTVPNLAFGNAEDPYQSTRNYTLYPGKNVYNNNGGVEIDNDGVEVLSSLQCIDRCNSDWSCDCVVYSSLDSMCYKRAQCNPNNFDIDNSYDVYVRQWS